MMKGENRLQNDLPIRRKEISEEIRIKEEKCIGDEEAGRKLNEKETSWWHNGPLYERTPRAKRPKVDHPTSNIARR